MEHLDTHRPLTFREVSAERPVMKEEPMSIVSLVMPALSADHILLAAVTVISLLVTSVAGVVKHHLTLRAGLKVAGSRKRARNFAKAVRAARGKK